jgi:hypothetical protein
MSLALQGCARHWRGAAAWLWAALAPGGQQQQQHHSKAQVAERFVAWLAACCAAADSPASLASDGHRLACMPAALARFPNLRVRLCITHVVNVYAAARPFFRENSNQSRVSSEANPGPYLTTWIADGRV